MISCGHSTINVPDVLIIFSTICLYNTFYIKGKGTCVYIIKYEDSPGSNERLLCH